MANALHSLDAEGVGSREIREPFPRRSDAVLHALIVVKVFRLKTRAYQAGLRPHYVHAGGVGLN